MPRDYIRCWKTGIDIPLTKALVLNRQLAVRLHAQWSKRLIRLEEVLRELGPPVGSTAQAQALGLHPAAWRVVCAEVARAHARTLDVPKLFRPMGSKLLVFMRSRTEGHKSRTHVPRKDDPILVDQIRILLDPGDRAWAAAEGVDRHLAAAYSLHGTAPLRRWLANAEIRALLREVGYSCHEQDRAWRSLLPLRAAIAEEETPWT